MAGLKECKIMVQHDILGCLANLSGECMALFKNAIRHSDQKIITDHPLSPALIVF